MSIKQTIKITSIDGGISEKVFNAPENSFHSAIGIDPDIPAISSGIATKGSGLIIPSQYNKFSGTEIDGLPYWIITQPKTVNSFVYTSTGKLHSFDNVLAMRATDEKGTSLPISITGGAGNGAAYYNNFIYLAEATDISQYGGMDSGASIAATENVWTGAKFGKTALNNVTYPIIGLLGVPVPNHPMHVHGDNALYIGDVLPTTAGATLSGRGCLHKIKTKRTTIDGDTDDGSGYNVFDLPYGYWPTDIESYGTDLVIAAIQTTSGEINQGRAELFFWDTFSDTFYNRVPVPDPFVTALYNKNGILYVFSGNGNLGCRVSAYTGGRSLQQIRFIEDGVPPLAGGVDAVGDRIVMAGFATYPGYYGTVWATGTKYSDNTSQLNNIAVVSGLGSKPAAVSVKVVQHVSFSLPRYVIGWADSTSKGLDKYAAPTFLQSSWRSRVYQVGKKFVIKRIILPLTSAVTANTQITCKVFTDSGKTSYTLPVINNTNNPSATRVTFKEPSINMNPSYTDFFLEFAWAGTQQTGIGLPIEVQLEVQEDQD